MGREGEFAWGGERGRGCMGWGEEEANEERQRSGPAGLPPSLLYGRRTAGAELSGRQAGGCCCCIAVRMLFGNRTLTLSSHIDVCSSNSGAVVTAAAAAAAAAAADAAAAAAPAAAVIRTAAAAAYQEVQNIGQEFYSASTAIDLICSPTAKKTTRHTSMVRCTPRDDDRRKHGRAIASQHLEHHESVRGQAATTTLKRLLIVNKLTLRRYYLFIAII